MEVVQDLPESQSQAHQQPWQLDETLLNNKNKALNIAKGLDNNLGYVRIYFVPSPPHDTHY